jgi:hypothetical protein
MFALGMPILFSYFTFRWWKCIQYGVRLSNLANHLIQLNSTLPGTSERINQAMPYLELFAGYLGDGLVAILAQQFIVLLQCMCRTSSGVTMASRACSAVGLRLRQQHPSAQTGASLRTTPYPTLDHFRASLVTPPKAFPKWHLEDCCTSQLNQKSWNLLALIPWKIAALVNCTENSN